MSRYIDADAFENKLRQYCKVNCPYTEKQRDIMCGSCGIGDAMEMLDDVPTADAVEVVRCKDCIHRLSKEHGDFYCETDNLRAFCSYGERRKVKE